MYDVIVIGGGPSGMMAAGRAGELGAKVLILEKNKELGKKLKITGGGRCNITKAEFKIRKFLDNFSQASKFLHSPFSQFSAKDTFTFFEEKLKLPLVIEAKNRAFPKSQKATDVCHVLEKYLQKYKVEIQLGITVTEIRKNENRIHKIKTDKGDFEAKFYILATGGLSAPETGSTGDGLRFLNKLEHKIKKIKPNVVPLTTKEKWVQGLSGTTWSFLKLSFKQNNKTKIKKLGKILFTHFGISGPLVLNSSYEVQELLEGGPVSASLDLFPETDVSDLDRRIWRLFELNKNKMVKNILPELLNKKLSETILAFPNLNFGNQAVNSITKEERRKITNVLKNLEFEISGTLGYKKSVVTAGGIDLKEINFKTMQSIKYNNLYILGDLLNINRPSGGYSLQLCWTTGWVAGSHVASQL
ncbi:hypothetical protein A2995_01335 [Candidatus Nomurabacteria bacterium RIFCSPLOWO2_01_FULL_33_24]|uniref:FAD-dependent oxidoreductase n=1 Tax=Candidatus Nomurabacteria bacterium RIFCSPLOWO2_01_FULL_33_24 TaxID=1801765 RepID=A0A1F6X0P6_9BACT|nr:MAG: hypothetical protein A2995_01335 [Candidatus Nomurabacteria bacterium RIFCSPLOWO2_01_FULL_33_24]